MDKMEEAKNEKTQITPIAVTNWRDIRRIFGIKQKNRRGHMYVIGKTGTGKSTLIANMVISDLREGNGLALIDPHGDLAETVLQYVPKERVNDVIYFNATDFDYPIAFNPLRNVHPDQRHLVVSGLISVFKKLWSEFWGPRMEHIIRYSLLTLLEFPGSTLLDLPALLTDNVVRRRAINRLTDPHVRSFWINEFQKYTVWLKAESTAPILNRLGQFASSAPVRNIVGQAGNTFSVRRAMDEGKILIVNVSKGEVGEDNCSLLGALLVTQIQLATLHRAYVREESRHPFYLYIDEFHNFITVSLADMLSESRKFGLNLVLANQYLDQLHEKIRAAVLGNVGSLLSFRVGSEDARFLVKEFAPEFEEADLINLPNYQIYLKLMVNGVTSRPFSATTLPLPEAHSSRVPEIVKNSRIRYAKKKEEVEARIHLKSLHLKDEYEPKQNGLFS